MGLGGDPQPSFLLPVQPGAWSAGKGRIWREWPALKLATGRKNAFGIKALPQYKRLNFYLYF